MEGNVDGVETDGYHNAMECGNSLEFDFQPFGIRAEPPEGSQHHYPVAGLGFEEIRAGKPWVEAGWAAVQCPQGKSSGCKATACWYNQM